MDYEAYREAYFIRPEPQPRFEFADSHALTLFFADYESALSYYERVLGPPAYVQGHLTHGWRVGESWLTLFPAAEGSPRNVEVSFIMRTPAEAERLQTAFVEAGGTGEPPSDQLMYVPVRSCPVRDPFGTEILISAPLTADEHHRTIP